MNVCCDTDYSTPLPPSPTYPPPCPLPPVVYKEISEADVLINFASLRSAYDATHGGHDF